MRPDLFAGQSTGGLARTSDPKTSHEAAASVDATRLERLVYEAIKGRGDYGATWDEIHGLTGIDKASISPRFAPLREKGYITITMDLATGYTPKKRPGRSGRGQIVWIRTKHGMNPTNE